MIARNKQSNDILNRIVSLFLVAGILFQTIICVPNVSAAPSAESVGQVLLGNTSLAQTQALTDNGDGSYTLKLTLDSKLTLTDENQDAGTSRNYYYTAPFSGNYLVQLWGGDGAPGSNTSYSKGGTGGSGGYVYGTIYLQAGQTLYYQLGGDGNQTQVEDEGGGINGDGGGHGGTGSLKVGGGGGYSAVYKFEALEFEKNYTDGTGNMTAEISEEDRATKYILIAGGGGGGGAGNGMSPLLGITATGTADGGAAGSVGSASGVLSGSGYDVEGTFFAGADGKSSGTVTNFVGHGGTNVPGEINATALGSLLDLFQGKQPNDWRGLANENYAGGSGGSGNLRGGAGGAGFCGGSGGVQAGLLSAYSIGGGGGGSSFIASNVTYTGIDDILSSNGLSANPSSTGGAVHIVALDAQEHLSYLNDLTLSGTCSQYFDVTSEDPRITATETGFTASKINLAEGGSVTLILKLTPKAGFMGGNNVPMWESGITCSTTDGSGHTAVIPVSDNCGYANVPLQNFTVNAHSHSTNVENPTYPVESSDQEAKDGLYTDDYKTLREQIENGTADWRYDFIQSIGTYYVQNEDSTAIGGASVSPTASTRYRVLLDVTPKTDSYAAVGDPVLPTTFMKYAVITITPPGEGSLFDNEFTGQKSLTFDKETETYQLAYTFDITRNVDTNALESPKPYYYDTIGSFTVPENKAGYYLIQAWGGNGGNGGTHEGGAGGSGGAGGYVYGYIHLNAGDIIHATTGKNGSNGSGGRTDQVQSSGGEASRAGFKDGKDLIIAGGGGGGGNGGNGDWNLSSESGTKGSPANTEPLKELTGNEVFAGGEGGAAVYEHVLFGLYKCSSGGGAGTAGANYRSSTMSTDASALTAAAQNIYNTKIAESSNPNPNKNGGSVIITCLQLDEAESGNPALKDFSFGADISKYFTVESVTVDTGNGGTYDAPVIDSSTNQITIGNIDPAVSSVNTATGRTETAGYKVTITLKAKDGFLGGNDVPVLEYGNVDSLYKTGMYVGQTVGEESKTEVVIDAHATDFANVAIPDLRDYASVTAKEHTIVAGDSVDTADMYENVRLKPRPTDWEAEFVVLTQMLTEKGSTTPITSPTVSPQVTTWYDMTLALAPKAAPVKATVITEAETQTLPCQPVIYVLPRVVYELTHLTTSETLDAANRVTIPVGEDYTATLTANTGYTLPDSITITRNDDVTLTVGDDYTYNATTGAFTVYASAIDTRQITVTATAPLKTHTLTYHYETSPGVPHQPDTTQFYPNQSIESTLPFTHDPVDVDGYSYVQSWEVDGEAIEWVIAPERADRPAGVPVTMPESDVWVFGHYKPNDYTLTIHYYYKDTADSAAASHTETVTYGSAYSVTSPVVSGYLADRAVISGTMGASDTTINVYYTPTANQLNILYFKTLPDGSLEQFDSHNSTVATDASYAVTSPALTGYTVEAGKETVSGTMTAEGVTVQVVYTPNRYTVTLDANGGTCTKDGIIVAYNNLYGYVYRDGAWGYDSLPTPVRVGYNFQGWYLDGEKVTEATTVTTAANHTLTAKWEGQEFKYIIRHIYEDGTSVADGGYDISVPIAVGEPVPPESYTFVPTVDGYTADKTRVDLQTTMVAQNVVVTITYTSNYRTLTIHYKYADTVEDTDKRGTMAAESYTHDFDVVKPDDLTYSVHSPTITDYSASQDTVSGTMGMEDVTVTVYYYDKEPVVSVTVTWGNLSYSYTHGTWSPETHTYSTEIIKPDEAGKNTVTVTNNAESEIPINAQFSYAAASGYEAIAHFFTATDNMAAANITQTGTMMPGEHKKAHLWLRGTLDRDETGTVISGICTVTITGGG